MTRLGPAPRAQRQFGQQPYFVRYYDSESQSHPSGSIEYRIAMEYCPTSLLDELNRAVAPAGLQEGRAVSMALSVACALETMHAHSPPIAHRDVKVRGRVWRPVASSPPC